MNDSAIFNFSFQFGTILLRISLTLQIPICMYNHPLIFLYLVLKLSNKVYLKQAKPFAEFELLFATSVQYWHTHHKSYIKCIDPHLLWVQIIISIINHPWLYWKFVLDNNILLVSDFSEGLDSILFITFLSKDKVPSAEKTLCRFHFLRKC